MDVENVIYIFVYNFANVGMKPECKGWNIFVHLYDKKGLKIWWTRCGIREFGVDYPWGNSNRYVVVLQAGPVVINLFCGYLTHVRSTAARQIPNSVLYK